MKITASTAKVLAATSLLVSGLVSGSAWAANPVTVWVRTPGSYDQSGTSPPKTNPQTLDLDKLPQQQGQRQDAQYGSSAFYRGVALRDVIKAYAPPRGVDLALLHFRNGMIVPVAFRDNRVMTRLDLLIATGRSTTAQGPFVSDFPPISRPWGTAFRTRETVSSVMTRSLSSIAPMRTVPLSKTCSRRMPPRLVTRRQVRTWIALGWAPS